MSNMAVTVIEVRIGGWLVARRKVRDVIENAIEVAMIEMDAPKGLGGMQTSSRGTQSAMTASAATPLGTCLDSHSKSWVVVIIGTGFIVEPRSW